MAVSEELTPDRLHREAHLWLAEVDDSAAAPLAARYRDLLSVAERRRLDRFRVERGRREYLLGRALARTVLSQYGDPAPREWELTPDDRGRPEITGPQGAPPLVFNLAHSHGLVACLVTAGVEGGVDVESPERSLDVGLLAQRYFSPREQAEIGGASREHGRDAFFRYWTLKEAYLKALGVGISLPLRSLSFRVLPPGWIDARFEEPLSDDPGRWQFDLYRAGSGHFLATALRSDDGEGRTIVARRIVPLAGDGELDTDLTWLASSRRER